MINLTNQVHAHFEYMRQGIVLHQSAVDTANSEHYDHLPGMVFSYETN